MHHTNRYGDIGVAKVIADLLQRGTQVLQPIDSTSPFDLVTYDGTSFKRVQVKYRTVGKDGYVDVAVRRADVRNGKAVYKPNEEVDIVAVYVTNVDKCYYFDYQPRIRFIAE